MPIVGVVLTAGPSPDTLGSGGYSVREMFETSEVEVDADVLEASLTKRLRARAARADSAVQITPEVLAEWVREELESLMTEIALVHTLARARALN